jgi:hypothetical protein
MEQKKNSVVSWVANGIAFSAVPLGRSRAYTKMNVYANQYLIAVVYRVQAAQALAQVLVKEPKPIITAQEFVARSMAASYSVKGIDRLTQAYCLKTAHGTFKVGYVRNPFEEPWAICPKANGDFGLSFAIGPETLFYSEEIVNTETTVE